MERSITPGHAPHLGFGAADDADIDIALLEDAVLGQQAFDIVQHGDEVVAEFQDVLGQAGRHVLMHPAGAEITRHACAQPEMRS